MEPLIALLMLIVIIKVASNLVRTIVSIGLIIFLFLVLKDNGIIGTALPLLLG